MAGIEHTGPTHPAHASAFELLPWYQNGSLGPDERRLVQAHLGECLVCARELRRLNHLARAVQTAASEQACARAYQRLAQEIRRSGRRSSWWPQRWFGSLRGLFEPLPLVSSVALVVVSAVLVAALVDRGQVEQRNVEQRFLTLGYHQALPSELSRPLVRIVLRDESGEVGRAAWLVRHGAEIVEGPSAIGVLTVRVDIGQRTMGSVLDQIRADPETLFVEAVDVIGTRPDRRR